MKLCDFGIHSYGPETIVGGGGWGGHYSFCNLQRICSKCGKVDKWDRSMKPCEVEHKEELENVVDNG